MSLAIVHSRAQVGVQAPAVIVEAHLANGLPTFTLVGLPEAAVKESKDRVRSAILNCAFEFPQRRITLNVYRSFISCGHDETQPAQAF
jgi:magnesium chelatase family protein